MKTDMIKMALILGLLSWIGPFAIDMYLPAMPAITEDLSASVSASQWTLMSFFIAFGLCQLLYGPASDVFGRKPPLYFGLGIFGLASLGCAFAPNIEWLIALRFLQGVGAASVMSIPRAVIRDRYTGTEATRLMSTIMLVVAVSPMLAPLLGSAVIVPFGWRAVFLSVAVVTVLGLFLTGFALKETLNQADRAPFRFNSMMKAFGVLFRDPGYMGLTLIGGMGMASFFAFLATASFLYTGYYGLTSFQFSLAFALNALGFFSTSQIAANLGARFGSIAVVKWAVAGYATSACVLFMTVNLGYDSFPLLVSLLLVTYAFLGLVVPTSMVLSLEEHGPIAGTAAALGGTLQMMLGAVSIAVVSVVFDGTPVMLAGAIALCSLLAVGLSVMTLRGAPQEAAA
ncbi:multidrug effflux MFS transporter [Saccharospirillum salsuginis]|uniref:Bcr/CflA family efflux transporter n=1 Tax=Saccharospirillum salsuginis TaxID=418750 RepID=A0A918KA53_9GAMM|nr:multidrug effflux MFS transporter [Saccharospirillum salsuginis]GGX54939.1 Bcr/CflA family drug resistance efflux transporter [Saccharospirillum salsuginis]